MTAAQLYEKYKQDLKSFCTQNGCTDACKDLETFMNTHNCNTLGGPIDVISDIIGDENTCVMVDPHDVERQVFRYAEDGECYYVGRNLGYLGRDFQVGDLKTLSKFYRNNKGKNDDELDGELFTVAGDCICCS